jgi:hypothetical protein
MTVDSRWQVFFTSTGPGAGAGRAVAVYKDNVEKKFGTVASGGIQGRNVDFTLRWDDGSLDH